MKAFNFFLVGSALALGAADAVGDLTLHVVPVGSSTIAGGQQVTLEVHVESDVDLLFAGGQVDLSCLIENGSGSLTSVQVFGDEPALGTPRMCPGGLVATNTTFCRVTQTKPPGSPGCFLAANQLRYVATIVYEVSDCAEGSFSVSMEPASYSSPPLPEDLTKFLMNNFALIPIAAVNAATLSTGSDALGVCCDGTTCLEDGLYGGCCYQTHPGAQFYVAQTCEEVDPCRGPCCLPGGDCTSLDAPACLGQGGTPQPNSAACTAPEACCLSIGECQMLDRFCCVAQNGVPQGAGSSCDDAYACCTQPTDWQLLWSEPWTAPGKIKGAHLDGSSYATVVAEPARPRGIAVDRTSAKLYWTFSYGADTGIKRSNLDGTGVETLINEELNSPGAIALDLNAGKMYWTDLGTHSIRRAGLDGSAGVALVTGVSSTGLALNIDAGKMYWTEDQLRSIQRANLDGSGVETIVPQTLGRPQEIAADSSTGKIYWTESLLDSVPPGIYRANGDGSAVELLVAPDNSAFGIDLDVNAGKMYWAAGKIQRANLDGTNVETLITDVSTPVGLALALPPLFGDMDNNDRIDVDDIFCVIGGFIFQNSCPPADIHPCGGNTIVDVDDITTMLDVFIHSTR